MNSKKKIISSIIFCFLISIGFVLISINNPTSILNNNEDNDESSDDESGTRYPSEDNPYFSQYYYYLSGRLPYYQPSYDIDINSSAFYFDLINQAFSLTNTELNMLDQNKFVVLNRMGTDDIVDAFSYYWDKDLPIFITSDSILHIWHLIFDQILENTEENIFFPLLSGLTIESLKKIINISSFDPHTVIYFNVAFKLINSSLNMDIPFEIENASQLIFNSILDCEMFPINNLTKRFIDDYSQYKPRGHYTKSESLKSYFRLYKWFARIPFFFDLCNGALLLDVSPEHMIKTAIEVLWLLNNVSVNYLDLQVSGIEIWDTITRFLNVIMGYPNSITVKDLNYYSNQIFGDNWTLHELTENDLTQLQNYILNDSVILKPEMPFFVDLITYGVSPKTFTFFGEMETLDSYSFQNVTHPYVAGRGLPHGLDFAYICLESNRSLELLQNTYSDEFEIYPSYLSTLKSVQNEISSYQGNKKDTLQWNWINSLKTLTVKSPESNDSVFLPEFMNSSAWLDEKLTTVMGSWAQLRHDTILYTKQSYGGIICSTPTAFVEPYPFLYRSLGELAQLYKSSFVHLSDIGYNLDSGYFNFLRFLDTFTNICFMLENISVKELARIPLNSNEKTFLTSIYHERTPDICGPTQARGWLPYLLSGFSYSYVEVDSSPNSRATLVADVHTEPNTREVLHVATGFLEHIIAYVPSWDGHEIPVIGPVFSYYEFPTQNLNRLTDEEWRGILAIWLDGQDIEFHDFDLIQRGFWATNYMVSDDITSSLIYRDNLDYNPPSWF